MSATTGDPLDHPALLAAAQAILPWMIEIRRDLHRHPELGLEEHRTAARVGEVLDELRIPHRDGLAQTGVLGLLEGGDAGRVVALRADLDALPLQDGKEHAPYRSTIAGRMHACGHDVHTTVLLGAARLLVEQREHWQGLVKLIFQPAEETVGGARMLVEEGVLEDPAVEAIFGLHVDPGIPVGTFGIRYGQRNASSDDLAITVHGRSCHGAFPAAGVDAIVVAAQVVTALQTIVSRNVDARQAAVITLGTIHGGTQGNIVPARVEMVGTIRTLDPTIREQVKLRIREVAEGVAAAHGARAEVVITPSYDPVVNTDAEVDLVRDNVRAMFGDDAAVIVPRPSMGVEDFGFYLTKVPGAFYALGVRDEARGIVHPVHNELFDVDEACLAAGAAMQVANVLSVVRGRGR